MHASLSLPCTVGHWEFTCVEASACVGCPHLSSEPHHILHLYLYRSDKAVTMMIPGWTSYIIADNTLVFAALPAHNRWLGPGVKASIPTSKSIFIFPHYLSAYHSEAIKVAAGLGFWPLAWDDFHSSKLANQTLDGKKEGKSAPMNYAVLFHNIYLLHLQTFHVHGHI